MPDAIFHFLSQRRSEPSWSRLGVLAVSALLLSAPLQAKPNNDPSTDASQAPSASPESAKLHALQERIKKLDALISRTDVSYSSAEKKLRAAERAVSKSRRALHKIEQQARQAGDNLASQEKEYIQVMGRINNRKQELAKLIEQRYRHSASSIAPFLADQEPNQIARNLNYLSYIGEAQIQLIENLRADLQKHRTLTESMDEHRKKLRTLTEKQREQTHKLEAQLKKRTQSVQQIKKELKNQKKELSHLRQDEANFKSLIETANQQSEIRTEAAISTTPTKPAIAIERPRLSSAGAIAQPKPTPQVPFSTLRGKLLSPIAKGRIGAHFNQRRKSGGTVWRGLLIQAPVGTAVRAAAAGRIVYADWLRGYGNLVIIDHGQGWLTVYGYNDTLLADVGEQVAAGSQIGQAGSINDPKVSGVYFEIRHQSQALDPRPWLKR